MTRANAETTFKKHPSVRGMGCLYIVVMTCIGLGIASLADPKENPFITYVKLPTMLKYGLPMILAGLILGPIYLYLVRRHDNEAQGRRDDLAANILKSLESGARPLYHVYLRSFWVTGKLDTNYMEYSGIQSHTIKYPHRDFEYLLSAAHTADEPLIGLGRRGEALGAGRIETSDKDWKATIETLCRAAKMIYVCPLDTEGTRWEMAFLKQERLLSKSVFIIPPDSALIRFTKTPFARAWEVAREAYRQQGFEIPEYTSDGMLFRLNDECRLEHSSSGFSSYIDPEALRRSLELFALAQPREETAEMLPESVVCPKCGRSTKSSSKQGQVRCCAVCGMFYVRPPTVLSELGACAGFLILAVMSLAICWAIIVSGDWRHARFIPIVGMSVLLLFCGLCSLLGIGGFAMGLFSLFTFPSRDAVRSSKSGKVTP